MLTQIVNLTELCITKELVCIILKSDQYKPNLANFVLQDPAYQQQLIQYVLSQINHRYLKIKNLSEIPKSASKIIPRCPIEEQLIIRQLLETKILEIARESLLYRENISA